MQPHFSRKGAKRQRRIFRAASAWHAIFTVKKNERTMKEAITASETNPHIVLIGAGIMSATLGMLLKELDPDLKIELFERLDVAAAESSDAWNNAGTSHSAFCELNYTPE